MLERFGDYYGNNEKRGTPKFAMILSHEHRNNKIVRKLFLILASTLLFTCCRQGSYDAAHSDRKQDGLAGSVQSVRIETSKMIRQSGDYIEGPREVVETKTYDAKGRMTEERYTAADDAPLYTARYIFDGNGRKKERGVYAPNETLRTKREFKYDTEENLIEWSEYDADGLMRNKNIYTYNDDRQVSERTVFNGKGSVVDRWTYAYDENGNKKDEARYYADGSIDTRYVYTLDEKGNRVETSKYNAKDEAVGKESHSYEFDSKGNWIKRTTARLIDSEGKTETEPVEITYRKIAYY